MSGETRGEGPTEVMNQGDVLCDEPRGDDPTK